MKKKDFNSKLSKRATDNGHKINLKNMSPASKEDNYSKSKSGGIMNPESLTKIKKRKEIDKTAAKRKININSSHYDTDLDIADSELENELEYIGSDDEENNYYNIEDAGLGDIELEKEGMKSSPRKHINKKY